MTRPGSHDRWRKATEEDFDVPGNGTRFSEDYFCTHDDCGRSPARLIASDCCGYKGDGACLIHLPLYMKRGRG